MMLEAIQEEPCAKRNRIATTIYILIMLTAFLLFTGTNGYVFLQLKKYIFFLSATTLWLFFLGLNVAIQLLKARRKPRMTLAVLCALTFAAAATISTLCSEYAVFFSTYVGKYDNLLTYLLYVGILIGVYRYGVAQTCILWAFAASYSICCGIALLQLCGWNAFWLFPEGYTYYSPYVQETGAFLGPLGNVDVFSALHSIAIPLFAGGLLFGTRRVRFLLLIPILMGLICQIYAGVAAGLLAISLTTILFVPGIIAWILKQRGSQKVKRWMYFSGVILFFFVLLILYLIPFQNGVLFELSRAMHGELRDTFGSHRILIWRKTAAIMRKHFLIGIGPDALENYLDISFERYSEALGETLRTTVDNAHNTYLQVLISFGMVGLIPLSTLMVEAWNKIITSFRRSLAIRVMCLPLFCYLIQAFFNVGTCIVVPIFLILWGLLLREPSRPGFEILEGNIKESEAEKKYTK